MTINILRQIFKNITEEILQKSRHLCSIKGGSFNAKNRKTNMFRNWQDVGQQKEGQNWRTSSKVYRLMSYNILAQDLLKEHINLYINIQASVLHWNKRLHALQQEISYINPDILCLQEMQYDHLKLFVNSIRGGRQLEYVFKKKVAQRSDGCAIIYDKQKFQLLEHNCIEYHHPGEEHLNRENVALLAKFKERSQPKNQFIVATTHLLYNPRRTDVRLAQVEVLLAALNEFSLKCQSNADGMIDADERHQKEFAIERLPILLTGDFNFTADSDPFQKLTSPQCETNASNRNGKQNSRNNKNLTPEALQLRPLNFGQGTASTFQNGWITVDHIFESIVQRKQSLKVCGVLTLPEISICYRNGKIPNHWLGSDHFSLSLAFSML